MARWASSSSPMLVNSCARENCSSGVPRQQLARLPERGRRVLVPARVQIGQGQADAQVAVHVVGLHGPLVLGDGVVQAPHLLVHGA